MAGRAGAKGMPGESGKYLLSTLFLLRLRELRHELTVFFIIQVVSVDQENVVNLVVMVFQVVLVFGK